jgi:hypothetical protein
MQVGQVNFRSALEGTNAKPGPTVQTNTAGVLMTVESSAAATQNAYSHTVCALRAMP